MSLYPPELDDDQDLEADRGRVRVLLSASLWPVFLGYAGVVVVLALVIAVATRTELSTASVLFAALPGWLGVHQVPLTLDGQHFGALPLLPTLLVFLLVGRSAANAADRLFVGSARETVPVIGTIAVVHALVGAAIAQFTSSADVLAGMLVPAGVSALAAAVGLARRGYFEDVVERFDEVVVHGLRAGLLGLAGMVGIGALLVVVGLGMSFSTVKGLFTPGIGDSVGMFLLSVAYTPNAALGGTAFATGPGVSIGALTATPLHFSAGPLPAVPVLAALPEMYAPWWPLVFMLPLGIGALVGWVLRTASEDPIARLRGVGAAAVLVAAAYVVLCLGAGGRLAEGVFNPLTMHPWSVGMAMLLWIALPASVVTWWTGARLVLAPSRGLLDDAIEAESADAGTEPSEPAAKTAEPDPDSTDEDSAGDSAGEDGADLDSANPDDAGPDDSGGDSDPDDSGGDDGGGDEPAPDEPAGPADDPPGEPDLPGEIQK